MKIKIKETGKIENLSIIDPKSGVNWISDFIGNADGFAQFEKEIDEDGDATEYWICDQSTFDWWDKVVDEYQNLEDRIEEMKNEYGRDLVDQIVRDNYNNDMDLHPSQVNEALNHFLKDQEAAHD